MNARVKYPMLSRHPCSFHLQLQVNRTAGAPKVEPSSDRPRRICGLLITSLFLLTYSLFYLKYGFLGTMSAERKSIERLNLAL